MADSEGAVAPAVPASETSPPATWRVGRFAVASSLAVSVAIHLFVIAPILVLGSRLLQSDPATSMTVDLVTSEELAALTPKPAAPDETKLPTPEPQPPDPPAQSQPPASAMASADKLAMPFLPKPPPPRPPVESVDQLATLVGAPSVTDLNGGGASDFKANLTTDEIAAFAAMVQRCWSAPANLAKEPKLYVVIRVSLRRDGSLIAEPALQAGAASTLGPALVESAKRALRKCEPYAGLPAAKYDEWRVLDLRFVPSGISTAGSVSGGRRTPRSG